MQELPGPIDARAQTAGGGGYEDPDFGAGREEVYDVDWGWDFGWVEYIPEGRFPLRCL